MSSNLTLKFKIGPTPTLAKLYEEQGLSRDALTIYKHLNTLEEYDFTDKISALKEIVSASNNLFKKADKNSDLLIKNDNVEIDNSLSEADKKKTEKQEDTLAVTKEEEKVDSSPDDSSKDHSSTEKVQVPYFNSLIDSLFSDSEKRLFNIVPDEDLIYNNEGSLVYENEQVAEDVEIESVEEDETISNDDEFERITEGFSNEFKAELVSKLKELKGVGVIELENKGYIEIVESDDMVLKDQSDMNLGQAIELVKSRYSLETKISEIKVKELLELIKSKE